MRILLTNDDGILAPGLLAARNALAELGEVWVVAPERQRSAAGHSITLHKPLRLVEAGLLDGTPAFASNGTPTDCVTLGFDVLLEGRCDLVVSGINDGPNLGWDLTYSGTVSAAIEGAVLGLPAFAISLAALDGSRGPHDFTLAAAFVTKAARLIAADPLPANTLLNINVPVIRAGDAAECEVTHQGRREYVDRIVPRVDPRGRAYYWLSGSIREDRPDPGSDVHAILHNRISVTPVQLDMTAYDLIDRLKGWPLALSEAQDSQA